MASINSPQVVWINGRCHRINPTTDKMNVDLENVEGGLAAYQEPDLYGEDDREYAEEIQLVNNKFVSAVQVPSALHSRIIGPKGTVRKRLEYETKCQLKIPRMGVEGPLEVTGLTRDDVISCRQRIDMIILGARKKMRPTHFIGVPFKSEGLTAKFNEFTTALQNYTINGLTPDMITDPRKLHVTFNVLPLLDDNDRKKAVRLIKEFEEKSIKNNPKYKNIPATISGLNSFQLKQLNKCFVLYANVKSEVLQELGDAIYSHFVQNELSFEEFGRSTVQMHMTWIKGGKGKSFDCEQMFNELRDFDFGTIAVTEIHLSQMSTVDPDTGYYKATTVIPLS